MTDVSEVQLDLNRQHMLEAQRQGSVEAWQLLDVRDTSLFANEEFDAVVAYGGSLSYAFEQVGPALSGLLRVGHIVLASVMSSLGSWRFFLSDILDERAAVRSDVMDQVFRTGDLRVQGPTIRHPCQMFRWREVQQLVAEPRWSSKGGQREQLDLHDGRNVVGKRRGYPRGMVDLY